MKFDNIIDPWDRFIFYNHSQPSAARCPPLCCLLFWLSRVVLYNKVWDFNKVYLNVEGDAKVENKVTAMR